MAKKKGFSLVEITITITIIGILVYIMSPKYHRAMETTRFDMAVINLQMIGNAQILYISKNKQIANSLDDLVLENFLSNDFVKKLNNK